MITTNNGIAQSILQGKTTLGIELGSTRIKAVLIDDNHDQIAAGSHDWENRLENGVWTYSLEDIWAGLQSCYTSLAADVRERYNVTLTTIGSIGFSAMMHGYMAFNKGGELLVPFRTWRNTTTGQAAQELTKLFGFNIPHRWSIAHLYQAILWGEEHVRDVDYITTLAGFIHWKLTGEKVLGIGDASGMFPIDSKTNDYNTAMVEQFDELIAGKGYTLHLRDILPQVLTAGKSAGTLTTQGAALLDPAGQLTAGIPLCPPEGDAGTGMVATNAVAERTGNVSAGTSVFAMIVLENELSRLYPEIDMVTTPTGKPVAMVHCNNCTSDINAWAYLFSEFAEIIGAKTDMGAIYTAMFERALAGDAACGNLVSYNYFSGEPITQMEEGRPLLVRMPDSKFSFANFMKSILYSAVATLKLGMDILEQENVQIDRLLGHGGFFKTPVVGQRIMAAAIGCPVSVMESAGEGGAWGIALLAAYMNRKQVDESLESYLNEHVFASVSGSTIQPAPQDIESFADFMKRYCSGLDVQRTAVRALQ